MSELGNDKPISCDGWPDRYQERNTLNHIKTTRLLEGVVAGCYRTLWGCGRDNAITPKEERKAIKSQRRSQELRASSTGLAFREHRRRC